VSANGHTIAEAVDFLVRASRDPELVKKYASEPQSFSLFSGEKPPAWLELWAARHPDKTWSDLLTTPVYDANIGGDTTIYAAPALAR
jgi:hypothetical protein